MEPITITQTEAHFTHEEIKEFIRQARECFDTNDVMYLTPVHQELTVSPQHKASSLIGNLHYRITTAEGFLFTGDETGELASRDTEYGYELYGWTAQNHLNVQYITGYRGYIPHTNAIATPTARCGPAIATT